MKKTYKRVPFDIELAKKIQAGEIEGRIVRNGCEVVILDFNSKKYSGYPIRIAYLDKDEVDYVTIDGLHIEVPDAEPHFKPFDRVLVRKNGFDKWKANFFSHMDDGYYKCVNSRYKECVLFEGNEHLVGTTNNPE